MLRCASTLFIACALALPAAAQLQRNFTAQALRGEIVFGTPPEVRLNGKPARLAPGARIRDQNNLVQLSGSLVNQRYVVNYTRDLSGQLLDVWLLTPAERAKQPWPTSAAEAARKPWPTTEKEAQAWRFNPDAQAWTKP